MKIAFFDSGVGGLTIFKEAYKNIKAEYMYFADNLNTPYGIRTKTEVKKLTIKNIKKIINMGADIVVIACNTATSVAINELREMFPDKCIIGTEPAVKVAADNCLDDKKILVCATTLTTKEEKLKNLIDNLNVKEKVTFIPLDELVAFAENLDFNSNYVHEYLKEKFNSINLEEYGYLVLGCTHFPLFKGALKEILPDNISLIDSSNGVVKNIKNKIGNEGENKRNVTLILSKEDEKFINKFIAITGIREFGVKII